MARKRQSCEKSGGMILVQADDEDVRKEATIQEVAPLNTEASRRTPTTLEMIITDDPR